MRYPPLVSALFYITFAGGVIDAAPPNDHFAGRTPFMLPVATGTNIDATTEGGEPAVNLAQPAAGTVWWSFTPGMTGWYEITTEGSALDTVLAVYRGAALNDLVRVASADDDALNSTVSTSRVKFHATSGTQHAVQVGGFDSTARGTIVLGINSISPPPNRVTSLSSSPDAPFNLTTSDQAVTVTFSLEQSAALEIGTLWIARPDGVLLTRADFSAAHRTAGTAMAGTYQVTVTLPRYAPGGNYPVWFTGFSENAVDGPDLQGGGWVWKSFPSTTTPHLTVVNSGAQDTTAPSLGSAVLSPTAIDVTAAGVLITLNMQITDDLSGFTMAAVSLQQNIAPGQNAVLVAGTVTSTHLTGGTANNGQYQILFFVPQDAPAGAWQLHSQLTDRLGNTVNQMTPATLTVNKDPYPAWARAQNLTGPDADPTADPDRDGQTNLTEFAFHTHPMRGQFTPISLSVPDRFYLFQGAPPLQYFDGERLHLRFLRRRGANAGTVATLPQFSSGLSDWSPPAEVTVIPLAADWEMVEAMDSAPNSNTHRRLARVLVTQP